MRTTPLTGSQRQVAAEEGGNLSTSLVSLVGLYKMALTCCSTQYS